MSELIGYDHWKTTEPDWPEPDPDEIDEPTGSCDECGVNVYGSLLCDSCEFMIHEAESARRSAPAQKEGEKP